MTKLPDDFYIKGIELSKEFYIFGVKLTELSHDELLAACAQGWKAYTDSNRKLDKKL